MSFLLDFIYFIKSPPVVIDYIDKGFYVIDLKNKIEWLKCQLVNNGVVEQRYLRFG